MADEIAQVVQMEIQGVTMVFKGTLEVVSFLARAIKALINSGKNLYGKHKDYELNKEGKKTFKEMLELCNGAPPQALNIREDDFEEVLRLAEKHGLHYTIASDFIPNDGKVPILITPQEAPLWGQIYKAVASMRLDEDKKSVSVYDKLIAEEKEKLTGLKDPKEIVKIQAKIENLEQAKQEASKWVDYGEDILNKDDVTMSFQEYLLEAKGTDFEKNPELAMAEYEKGVEIGRSFSVKESFQPIRDKSLMTESKLMFYVPEIGAIVTREFRQDEQTDLVYSNYAVKTQEGEIFRCSDRDITKDKWNESVLPQLLDKAGVIEGTECRAFNYEEKLKCFLAYHNKITSPAQKNIEKALSEGKEVFSHAGAKNEVLNFVSEQSKGFASANVTETQIEIVCNLQMLVRDQGKLKLKLSDDESIVFSKIDNEGLAPNGMVKFTINDESKATYVKQIHEQETYRGDILAADGTVLATTKVSNNKSISGIEISPLEAQGKIRETLGEGIASMVQKGAQHKGR